MPFFPLCDNDALFLARDCLKSGKIVFTSHLKIRMKEKNFNAQDIVNVIENGKICRNSEWNSEYCNYRYFIGGTDLNGDELTLVVTFESGPEKEALVITGY